MAIDVLSYKATVSSAVQAQKSTTLAAGAPITASPNASKALSLGTSAANNAAGGADEAFLFLVSIAGSGNASIDLTSITDLLGQTGVTLARVKHLRIQLLSAADDAVNGTAAASVTVGDSGTNDLVTQSGGVGWLSTAASKMDVPNGGYMEFGVGNDHGVLVDSTHKIIYLANNDAGLAAKVLATGAGGGT